MAHACFTSTMLEMRRARRVIIALLLGLSTSVLVAWQLLFDQPLETTPVSEMTADEATSQWSEIVGPPNADAELGGGSRSSRGWTEFMTYDVTAIEVAADLYIAEAPPASWVNRPLSCSRTTVGWPMRCLYGDLVVVATSVGERPFAVRGWIPILGRDVVYAPLWPGLLVNTALYGGAFYGLILLITHLRRRARLDRKHCADCNYDLYGSLAPTGAPVACPECGSSFDAMLLARPRQVPRWWMLPLALPPLAILAGLFIAVFDWRWLRFQLHWIEPIATWMNAYVLGVACVWVFVIAWDSFDDRSRNRRVLLAAAITLTLVPAAFISLFAVVLHFSSYP